MGGGHDIHSVHVLDLFTGPLEQQRLSLIERGYVLEEIVILTANISLILDVESRGFHIERVFLIQRDLDARNLFKI